MAERITVTALATGASLGRGRVGPSLSRLPRSIRKAAECDVGPAGSRRPGASGTLATAHDEHWRIRLAAYGARLERVLGSRPRGFKSPILRRGEAPTCRFVCRWGLFVRRPHDEAPGGIDRPGPPSAARTAERAPGPCAPPRSLHRPPPRRAIAPSGSHSHDPAEPRARDQNNAGCGARSRAGAPAGS